MTFDLFSLQVEEFSPRAVYTSGKASSAAGLTAAVVRVCYLSGVKHMYKLTLLNHFFVCQCFYVDVYKSVIRDFFTQIPQSLKKS